MKEKWLVYAKKADFAAWGRELGVDPVIARIIRNRDVESIEEAESFLRGKLQDCHDPRNLKDADKAAEMLVSAISSGKRLRVMGDYDVDGICSSYILSKGLSLLGARCDVAIPHRIHDGYGLSDHLIREAKEGDVELILTCDNGIAAGPQIRLAKELGIGVIVTDHHEVPFVMEKGEKKEVLPEAMAVVDPKRSDDAYPFEGICGAVVAFKLLQILSEKVRGLGWKEADALDGAMDEFLEFAAFATVCDVMELKDENRILVREGLARMRHSANLGLRALLEVSGVEAAELSAYHLGFVLGPCLNATGRLDTAKRALELLNAKTVTEAVSCARDLKELNDSRKNLTLEGLELARQTIETEGLSKDKVLVVYLPAVHESLAGIIAGRIREQYGKPAFVLTKGEEGVKGSGRSIEAYHMYDALNETGELITKYGGHKMAAGLSLPEENVDAFRKALNERCRLTEEDFIPVIHLDLPMPMDYATLELAQQLQLLEPFGVGNPKPLFAQKGLTFLRGSRMGKNGQYGRFTAQTPDGRSVNLVYFGDVDVFLAWLDETYGLGSGEALLAGRGHFAVTVAYQLAVNTYRGVSELQFLIKAYQ